MKQSKHLYIMILLAVLTGSFVIYTSMRGAEKPKVGQEMLITKLFVNNNQFQLEQELNDFINDLIFKEYMIMDLIYAPTNYNFTVMLIYGPPEYSIKYKGVKI